MYRKTQKDPLIKNPNPAKNSNKKSEIFLQFLSQFRLSTLCFSKNLTFSPSCALSVFGSLSRQLSLSLSKKAKEKRKEMSELEKKKRSNKKMEMMMM
jgi:hypothetical protein